jgi:hypothetical protein
MSLYSLAIGSQSDYVQVPFVPSTNTALAYLQTGYYHVHGASFIYPDKADPVTVQSSVASWSVTGTIVEIIPANTITKAFDLHWASVSDISNTLYGIIDVFSGAGGAEIKIGSVDVSRTSNFAQEGQKPIQIPQQSANTRISCRFSDSTSSAQTIKIKLYGHVYSTSLT